MLDRTTTQIAAPKTETAVFERLESNVRSYARSFNAVFTRANGTVLTDVARQPLPRLPGRRRLAQLRPQQPGLQGRAGRLHHGRRHHPLARPAHGRQGALPRGDAERHPQAARPGQLRHAVRRPDRHQRGRSRAEDRPQGHRPPERHLLHQRLPRRVDGRAGGHRQLLPARRRRRAAHQHHRDAVRRLLRRGRRHHRAPREGAVRPVRRHGHPGRRDPRDRAGRGRA